MTDAGDKGTIFKGHYLPQSSLDAEENAVILTSQGRSRVFSSTAEVGDNVKVITLNGRKYIIGSGITETITPVPIPKAYSRWFNGYGNYLWELLSVTKDTHSADLGLWLIKRKMDSDTLEILSSNKIREAAPGEISSITGGYQWNEAAFGFNKGWNFVATDSIIYLRYGRRTMENIYELDKTDGTYTLLGAMPTSDLDETFMTDGNYIYNFRAFETPLSYHLTKVKVSDFSIAADYSSGGEYPVGCYKQGNYLYVGFYAYPSGAKSFKKHNVSDMSQVSTIATGDDYTSGTWNGSLTETNGSYSCVYWKDDIVPPIDYYTWIRLNPVTAGTKEITMQNEFA